MPKKSMITFAVVVSLVAVTLPGTLGAQESQLELVTQPVPKLAAAPQRLVESSGVEPVFTMHAADEAMVRPVTTWNVAGNLPVRNGIERLLPKVRLVALPKKEPGSKLEYFGGGVLARSPEDDAVVWGLALKVDGAYRMRIRLDDVRLPEGTRIWVYGENDETVGPFGTELVSADGTLWTPSVGGPEIRLEISVPDTAWETGEEPSFKIVSVSQTFPLDEGGVPEILGDFKSEDTSCIVDAACVGTGEFSLISSVNKAVAYLEYVDGGSFYICSGALVNDADQSTYVPYLLTANHCFSSQSAASTLEAFFDYRNTTCGGSPPPVANLPRTTGSTLLKTSATNDFTFVRLSQFPGGSRALLGWTATDPSYGEVLYRVSHPNQLPASYSRSSRVSPMFTCSGVSTTNYHYTQPTVGGTFGGSSGGSLVNNQGQIVGQLRGGCGDDPGNGCDYTNYDTDGKFSVTFPQISQYLTDDGGSGTPCTQNLNGGVVCLRNKRFEFKATWTDFSTPAKTQPLIWTPVEDINATGGFQNNPSGIQVVMRVADGCSLTGTWWIWLGGFTDAGWNITVRDTVTGKQKTFTRTRQSGSFPTTLRDQTTFTCN